MFKMDNKLQTSTISHETIDSDVLKPNSASSYKGRWCESFFTCFKVLHKKKVNKNLTDYDSTKCDYVVEKLIVKHVPSVFFAIPNKISSIKGDTNGQDTKRMLIMTKIDNVRSNIIKTGSLSCDDNLSQDVLPIKNPSKCLQNHSDITAFNEGYPYALSTNYNNMMNGSIHSMNMLCSSLNECAKPIKDPYPMSKSKKSLSKSVTAVTLITKTLSENDGSQVQAFKPFSVVPNQDLPLIKKELKIAYTLTNFKTLNDSSHVHPESEGLRSSEFKPQSELEMRSLKQAQNIHLDKHQYNSACKNANSVIIQPVHDTTCKLKSFEKPIVNSNQLNAQNYNHEHIKMKLQTNNIFKYNNESLTNESEFLGTDVNINPLYTKLKWRIIVKHCKSKTTRAS